MVGGLGDAGRPKKGFLLVGGGFAATYQQKKASWRALPSIPPDFDIALSDDIGVHSWSNRTRYYADQCGCSACQSAVLRLHPRPMSGNLNNYDEWMIWAN